jgi:hypothetical protein
MVEGDYATLLDKKLCRKLKSKRQECSWLTPCRQIVDVTIKSSLTPYSKTFSKPSNRFSAICVYRTAC